jgi:hypothetical protein
MPVGLQVTNNSNTVQLDEYSMTIAMVAKGLLLMTQVNTNGTGVVLYEGIISVPGVDPQVFIVPTGGLVSLYEITTSGGAFTFRFLSNAPASVPYYIFDKGKPPTTANYGLQVFTGEGVLAFDSGSKFLRVRDIFYAPASSTGSWGIPQDGRNYAVAMSYSRTGISRVSGGANPLYGVRLEAIVISGVALSTGYFIQSVFPANNTFVYQPEMAGPPQVLLVDVTHY